MAKEKQTEETPASKERYEVIKPFKDHPQYVKSGEIALSYKPGMDVSSFDKERLEKLISLGVVKKK